jgi:N-acetylmuramoyl-L-alanine amidase
LKLKPLVLITSLLFSSIWVEAQDTRSFDGIKTVVLDAGHGGRDPGNLGTRRYKTVERDIALAVTLRIGEYIEEYLPELKVVYTRSDNTTVTLERRAEIANEAEGDLFISIHCDSFKKSSVHGCSSIVLGKNHGDENRIALQENAVIMLEDDYETRYNGFDPNNPTSAIGLNLMQQTYLNESIDIASLIQMQFRERLMRKDRGVKQQPLYVTSRTAMPAVLVELGFLTNPEEEDFLNSEKGQSYLASAVFRAIRDFKANQDLLLADALEKQKIGDIKKASPKPVEEPTKEIKKPKAQPEKKSPLKVEPLAQEKKVAKPNYKEGVYFAVQILTSSTKRKLDDSLFKKLQFVGEMKENGIYKYYAEPTKSIREAQKSAKRMQALGFKGAFVIGLENGKKISASTAGRKLP